MGLPPLSRREREIMDVLFQRGRATVDEVRDELPSAPSYSAVRGLLRVLVDKGHLKTKRDGVRNVYRPTRTHRTAGRSAMKRALDTFFGGEVGEAMQALLDASDMRLGEEDAARLRALIEKAREEGR